jgi:hypothetical protein
MCLIFFDDSFWLAYLFISLCVSSRIGFQLYTQLHVGSAMPHAPAGKSVMIPLHAPSSPSPNNNGVHTHGPAHEVNNNHNNSVPLVLHSFDHQDQAGATLQTSEKKVPTSSPLASPLGSPAPATATTPVAMARGATARTLHMDTHGGGRANGRSATGGPMALRRRILVFVAGSLCISFVFILGIATGLAIDRDPYQNQLIYYSLAHTLEELWCILLVCNLMSLYRFSTV